MEEERILLQILGPDFPNFFFFPRRTGMKRGLPAVSTRSRSVATFRGSAMR